MSRAGFNEALEAARLMWLASRDMRRFARWPDDIIWTKRKAVPIPAISHLQARSGTPNMRTARLHNAIIALAPHVEWRHTYSEAEVGADFLSRYGWFELVGPEGHFHSEQTRMTVGFWGNGLHYDWHQHRAEELYCVLSGSALFMAGNRPQRKLRAGGFQMHGSNEPHAMITVGQPLLAFVIWRGEGLADPPAMST